MTNQETKKQKSIDYFFQSFEKFLQDPKLYKKYLVIHDQKIIKIFDEFPKALEYSLENLPKNEFIIQHVFKAEEVDVKYYVS